MLGQPEGDPDAWFPPCALKLRPLSGFRRSHKADLSSGHSPHLDDRPQRLLLGLPGSAAPNTIALIAALSGGAVQLENGRVRSLHPWEPYGDIGSSLRRRRFRSSQHGQAPMRPRSVERKLILARDLRLPL